MFTTTQYIQTDPEARAPCRTPPAKHFAEGKNDPAFRTRLAIGADLAVRARERGSRSGRSSRTASTGPGRVPRRARRGLLFSTAQQLGGALGVALFGTVFFGYLSGHTFEAALVHTAPYAIGAFALCAVLSLLLPRTAVSEQALTES